MKTRILLSALLAGVASFTALAQVPTDNASDIPARITETVFTEAPDDHVMGSDDAVQTLIQRNFRF